MMSRQSRLKIALGSSPSRRTAQRGSSWRRVGAQELPGQSFDFHSPHKNLKVQIAVQHPEGSAVIDGLLRTLYTRSGYIDTVIDYEPSASVKCAPRFTMKRSIIAASRPSSAKIGVVNGRSDSPR